MRIISWYPYGDSLAEEEIDTYVSWSVKLHWKAGSIIYRRYITLVEFDHAPTPTSDTCMLIVISFKT